jgi:hypothetical protein
VERVVLPDTVEQMGERAFAHANSLREVAFKVRPIVNRPGSKSFNKNTIAAMAMPASVLWIARKAFNKSTILMVVHEIRDMDDSDDALSDCDTSQSGEYPGEYRSNQIKSCSKDIHDDQNR